MLGNLPYNISSPLMFHLLEMFSGGRSGRVHGPEGSWNAICRPSGRQRIRGSERPSRDLLQGADTIQRWAPPVLSASQSGFHRASNRFRRAAPSAALNFEFLRKLVSKVFQQRRKTLANSLSGLFGLSAAAVGNACEQTAIDPKRRPETLSPLEFLSLAGSVRQKTRTGGWICRDRDLLYRGELS